MEKKSAMKTFPLSHSLLAMSGISLSTATPSGEQANSQEDNEVDKIKPITTSNNNTNSNGGGGGVQSCPLSTPSSTPMVSPLLSGPFSFPNASTSASSLSSSISSHRMMEEDFTAGIETSSANHVSIARDLHGPWLVMLEEEEGKRKDMTSSSVSSTPDPSIPDISTSSSSPSSSNSTHPTSEAKKKETLLLNGELFIEKDGVVFYRPAQQLGHGIGKIRIISSPLSDETSSSSFFGEGRGGEMRDKARGKEEEEAAAAAAGTAFVMDLEVYEFEPRNTEPPTCPTHWKISGVVNKVKSKKLNYSTFSLLGIWECTRGGEGLMSGEVANNNSNTTGAEKVVKKEMKNQNGKEENPGGEEEEDAAALLLRSLIPPSYSVGLLHAAKILPWEEGISSGMNAAGEKSTGGGGGGGAHWEPSRSIQEAFQQVFPKPLVLTSHLQRAKQKRDKVAKEAASTSSSSSPPFHLDLAPYRIAPEISELYYIPNYISDEEESQIIYLTQNTPEPFKSKLKKRTCQEWGGSLCEECEKSFVSDCNVPQWVQHTMDMQLHDGIFTPTTFPNSVRIHEYQEEEGIGPHTDGPIYVPLVTILSAASTSVMHFYPPNPTPYEDPMEHYRDTFKFKEGTIGSRPPLLSVVLEPCSLLIFCGKGGYFTYPHGIPANEPIMDLRQSGGGVVANRHLLTKEPKDINEIHRKYRVSITTRHLLSRCNHQPRRVEYLMKRSSCIYQQQPVPEPLFPPSSTTSSSSLPSSPSFSSPPQEDGQEDSSSSAQLRRAMSDYENSSSSSLFDTPTTTTTTRRTENVSTGNRGESSVALSRSLEAKLDKILLEQQDLKRELQEVQKMLALMVSSSSHFQSEVSGVLNHLTSTLLDVQAKAEDVAEWVEEQDSPQKGKQ